jgi:hypothetical protein
MVTRVRVQSHVGEGRHSIRGSGDARATTGQQAKTIETPLSGTRDATEGPRSFGLCCPRSTVSEEFVHEWLARTAAKLSSLVRRPDHNWQPYMCRS